MSTTIKTKENHKRHLGELLDIKKQNQEAGIEVIGLQKSIIKAVVVMEQEDVSWVEKIVGIKAL
ncbi:MAG: hypothetical protein FWG90_12355 [Oscillospiraceae bacterium]|nr:hypothetical protein [Oscillospiraceae bacterium]